MQSLLAQAPVTFAGEDTQEFTYRMEYGPVPTRGAVSNQRPEPGLLVTFLAAKARRNLSPEARADVTSIAMESELRRRRLLQVVYDERDKAIASMIANGQGLTDYVAFEVRNSGLFVMRKDEFPALARAVQALDEYERSERDRLEAEILRW